MFGRDNRGNIDISSGWGFRRTGAVVALLAIFALAALSKQLIQVIGADELVVIQSVRTGKLTWYTTPGPVAQLFGTPTVYKKRSIYEFTNKLRFNDGAHATMAGSIQYELPTDDDSLTALHVRFGSQQGVQDQLVQKVVDKSTYMTGPLMSSKESYAEKRNALIWDVEDQVAHGVYKTTQRDVREKDPITGVEKTITVVDIVMRDGKPERQEEAVLDVFKIKPFNFSIKTLDYEGPIEDQIAAQQKATMDVQTAMAEAKKAEQRKLTAASEGEAVAMKAKWEQEAIKAKAVTLAQQEKEVAETQAAQRLAVAQLDAQAAEQTKRQQILLGEGEGERKKLVMAADGALTQKLDTYLKAQELWANAVAQYRGNWVSTISMGGGQSKDGSSGATDLVSLLTAKTANDLALNMEMQGAAAKQRQQ